MWLGPIVSLFTFLIVSQESKGRAAPSHDLKFEYDEDIYPKSIPIYQIRKDEYTGKPVSRDRILQIQGTTLLEHPKKVTPTEFRKLMQCKKNDFNIDNTGIINMLKAMKLTKKGLIRAFYFVGMNINNGNHQQADHAFAETKKNSADCTKDPIQPFPGLFRLINNSLYFDHPVNTTCMLSHDRCEYAYFRTMPLQLLLNKVHGYKDSVFGFGDEIPVVSSMIPFPMFTSTSMDGYNDLVYPWWEPMKFEIDILHKAKNDLKHFRSYSYPNQRSWASRHAKALLLCTLNTPERSMYYHIAAAHPHHFVAGYINAINPHSFVRVGAKISGELFPLNPNSDETTIECPPRDCPNREPQLDAHWTRMKQNHKHAHSSVSEIGTDTICVYNASQAYHNKEMEKLCSTGEISANPTHFKYIIVPLGTDFMATANRLGYQLGYSGAVILMAESRSHFHFSSYLKPWVHYVPFTFSGADLVEKIQWLRDHDDMAQQIAENAQRFADSYLRLEDYFCYWNHALERLGDAFEGSEAVRDTFDPQPVCACPRSSENFFPGTPYCQTDL